MRGQALMHIWQKICGRFLELIVGFSFVIANPIYKTGAIKNTASLYTITGHQKLWVLSSEPSHVFFKVVFESLRSLHIAGRRIAKYQRFQEIPIREYTAFMLMSTIGPMIRPNTPVTSKPISINMP